MKKYLFGMLAIVLAVGFSAFTKPKSLDEKFVLSVNPVGTNLQATSTQSVGGGITVEYYTNWDVTTGYTCAQTFDDKACALELETSRVYDFGGTLGKRIFKGETGGTTGKTSYNMTVVNGYLETISPFTQYKKVNISDNVTNIILVKNKPTSHI